MTIKNHLQFKTGCFFFRFFAGNCCVICGVSGEVLHDHVLTTVGAKEQIQTIVNTLKKCHGLIKHFQHGVMTMLSSSSSQAAATIL